MKRIGATLCLAALLAGCGGGGGGGSSGGTATAGGGTGTTPTPSPTAGCSLRERQDWVAAQMNEWYLFPDTLPRSLDPTAYATLQDYVDALTATARAQNKDRYFTYVTSIAEENAYYNSGSTAGFGVRLSYDDANRRLFVTEAFEGAAALAAGVDRGSEILAIGTTSANLRSVDALFASGGGQAVSDALGPSDPGVTRVLRVRDPAGATKEVSVAKSDYTLLPVSNRYGVKIIDDAGEKIGYVNLRTFIDTADPALRDAFLQLRNAGVAKVIVDFRYNGGGLISIAELMSNLLGGNRSTSDVIDYLTFRPEKSAENETTNFAPQPQSVSPMRLAFIGTEGTASASELVINAFIPYLHVNAGLIGTNTYGKPVGQIALDKATCDDRLRVIAFALQNAARQGDYYNGLASKVEASCQAGDDLSHAMGDPQETSTRAALDYLAGRSCTPIGGAGASAAAARTLNAGIRRALLTPARPTTIQRETPGAF